ncbi:MAG: prepilin-type N-terminal cleavage/methylation domain-containing protein [Bacilli bacterium]|nr:prepilin-type N-terminal cleavage/methylation domain-containing protein [Bacilli bacterium]
MKKGFTLIELLSVIIILSITSLIIFPNIAKVINDSKEDLYNSQILDIQLASEKWASNNIDLLDNTHANDIYISLESLRFSGYLEPDPIKNPRDRSTMNGCIRIRYNQDNKKYNYIYDEKTCSTYANESNIDEEFGYIIYSYDRSAKTFIKESSSKEAVSTGYAIYEMNKKNIKVSGQTDSGLYDLESEYVFRGTSPNNYVTLTGKDSSGNSKNTSWRILSIDKKNYKVKLISTTPIATNTWNKDEQITFKESSLNELLMKKIDDDGIAYDTNKIINADYLIGKVESNEFSIDALKSTLNSNNIDNLSSQKVGTISILDYVNASASTCDSNFLSSACSENNYLKEMFGSSSTTWTLNNNGTQIWFVNSDGTLALTGPVNNKQIYAVVTLDSNTHISNIDTATGTSTNPFIIK